MSSLTLKTCNTDSKILETRSHVQVLPEVGVRQNNHGHLPEIILCLWSLSLTHASITGWKKVPVNAFCVQQVTPHDYLGSESSVRILEQLTDQKLLLSTISMTDLPRKHSDGWDKEYPKCTFCSKVLMFRTFTVQCHMTSQNCQSDQVLTCGCHGVPQVQLCEASVCHLL